MKIALPDEVKKGFKDLEEIKGLLHQLVEIEKNKATKGKAR